MIRYKYFLLSIIIIYLICSCTSYKNIAQYEDANELLSEIKFSVESLYDLSYEGGFPGRIKLSNEARYGENLNSLFQYNEIWNQPPGTPWVGRAMVENYEISQDQYFLNKAIQTARIVVESQLLNGGWQYRQVLNDENSLGNIAVFDDNVTQGCLLFLIKLDHHIDESWLSSSIDKGLSLLLKAQYTLGGWPQVFPEQGDYRDLNTFNDRTINDCIAVMIEAHRLYKDDRYINSARKGCEFIMSSQLKGRYRGWSQQYDQSLNPTKGRNHEMPAISSRVTKNNLQSLMNFYEYTKEKRFLKPIPDAIKWLESSKLSNNKWAFFYGLDNSIPVFFNYKGELFYKKEKVNDKVANYAIEGTFGIPGVIRRFENLNKTRVKRNKLYYQNKVKQQNTNIQKLLESRNENHLWEKNGYIIIGDNINNISKITRHLGNLIKSKY